MVAKLTPTGAKERFEGIAVTKLSRPQDWPSPELRRRVGISDPFPRPAARGRRSSAQRFDRAGAGRAQATAALVRDRLGLDAGAGASTTRGLRPRPFFFASSRRF